MVPGSQLLRPCALHRSAAPFQRASHNTSAVGQAGPGPGSSSTPSVLPSPAPCSTPATTSRQHTATLDRRDMLLLSSSLVVSHLAQLTGSHPAHAGQGISRYIRRKTLDPLETYVPLVLEARTLLSRAKALAARDVGAARELLRQGPYNGLRDNIRAIGEYAARDGRSNDVGPIVTGFFKALEAYDQLLYGALREGTSVQAEDLDARIQDLYDAFDRLLATVPPEILQRANTVLEIAAAKASSGRSPSVAVDAGTASDAGAAASSAAMDAEAADLVKLLR
ncbi:hypothetical protein Agub_g10819 [Astrephomene gubernaculifera]|uniref:DUF7880 domain-containing protein n=1 Tax=Astrephomene gubernaculifera TaxID=47775 RepID=A0AAD3HQA0_9CHLO|nr:hypothetical protein Agub_g10819 [Astrephomene gubernaculifera]